MNYELAKKLKDAGFPQDLDGNKLLGMVPYAPTLSELIEACGEDVWVIARVNYMGVDGWIAGQDSNTPKDIQTWKLFTFDPHVETAVANLWLALKNNQLNLNA